MIRSLGPEDAEACDAIVAGLPDWFGVPQGVAECAEAVRTQEGLVAVDSGEVVGFLTVSRLQPRAAEITWMAVRADRRRRGRGRKLIDALVDRLVEQGVRLLLVKTLAESDPDPGYRETRRFYEALGFVPAMGLDLWGPENPALLMVRPL